MNELGKKIFVSYKYKDNDVKMMPNVTQPTWPCDYVDYIKNKVLCDDDIYKGENSDEDISSWSEDDNCFDISQYERNWKVAAFAVDSMGNQFFGERDDTK